LDLDGAGGGVRCAGDFRSGRPQLPVGPKRGGDAGIDAREQQRFGASLNNGVTKDEIVDLFIHLEAYAGAARAFDSYQIALEIFAETTGTE